MAGEWNLSKIEQGLTAKGFLGWEIYYALEPFDEKRADYRAASIRQMIFNMAVNVKDRLPLEKFLLDFEQASAPAKKQSWQEKKAIAYAVAAAYSKPTPVSKKPSVQNSEQQAQAMATAILQQLESKE